MNYYEVSSDPVWHRLVDGLVVLTIGFSVGFIITQAMTIQDIAATPESFVQTIPSSPKTGIGASTELPPGIKIEEN